MDSTLIRLNTEVLVEMYKEGKMNFSDCLKNISQIGGLHLLDDDMLNKGALDIKRSK